MAGTGENPAGNSSAVFAGIALAAIVEGSRPALARAASLVENERPGAAELLAALVPHLGRAHVVGITGAPGAGKSTLIHALINALAARGNRVAVVAVDPSSPVSGGALLGDRIRMEADHAVERVFIRSLSARGHLGGLSRTTAHVVDVFDAAGFDVVIVETVGVGQSEIEIARVADTRVVVCPPGLGDEVQAIKAGILEVADLLVVSKGDLPGAALALDDLVGAARLRRPGEPPPVTVLTAAVHGTGVDELVAAIDAHARTAGTGQRLRAREASLPQPPSAPPLGAPAPMPGPEDSGETGQVNDDALFEAIARWRAQGKRAALATVMRTWGSSPRPQGSLLAVAEDGLFLGSVSGGCIEAAVIGEALEVIADGIARRLEYGVSDAQAWEVGLACGGRVQVYVERIG